ncbi:MAG: phage holin family protein [Desulfuromonadaceae bacterium]
MNNKEVHQDPTTERESFSKLLGQLAKNSAAVVHDEIQLVIQGIREKVRSALSGVVLIVTGLAISFAAFVCLCGALIIGLTYYMSPVIAALVTGVALALVGVVIAVIGYGRLKK